MYFSFVLSKVILSLLGNKAIEIMKYSIIKEKEGFSSQVRKYSEHKFKKDVLAELQSIAYTWTKNGGQVVGLDKKRYILVLEESDASATYIYQILEKY